MTPPGRRLDDRPLLQDHPTALGISLALWAVGGALFVLLAVPALADVVQSFDDAVWRRIVEWEHDAVVAIAKVFDFVGSTPVTLPIIVGMAAYLGWRRRWEAFWFWALAMGMSQLLIGPVKGLYERERPPLPLVETSDFSFPSGHAVAGAAIAVALVIVLVPAGPKRRNLEMLAAAFAVLMALSRVYLRAHWFTDVAAGASLGVAAAILAAVIVHRVDDGRRDRSSRD